MLRRPYRCNLLVLFVLLNTYFVTISANWWRLGTENASIFQNTSQTTLSEKCQNFQYLNEKQKQLCSQNTELLNVLIQGTKLSMEECQFQFRQHRWNCSIYANNQDNVFGNYFELYNTRESAFLHAISTAGVVFALTKACSKGDLINCPCTNKRSKVGANWKWGECSDDISYGEKFSKHFIDSDENPLTDIGLVNLHNNDAGRKIVKANMEKVCKCHGISGSCSMKICWKRLPTFRKIGEILMSKYEGASQVQVFERKRNKSKKLKTLNPDIKKPTKSDFVYLDESADFCEPIPRLSIIGTSGRACNKTSYGIDGCSIMCCGRGYQTRISDVEEKCNCRFVWCCNVECDICRFRKEEHFCN